MLLTLAFFSITSIFGKSPIGILQDDESQNRRRVFLCRERRVGTELIRFIPESFFEIVGVVGDVFSLYIFLYLFFKK
jgi:hypothetical protein